MARDNNYYVTEQEIAKLFNNLFPQGAQSRPFVNQYVKDYAALKNTSMESENGLEEIKQDVSQIDVRVSGVETNVSALNTDVNALNIFTGELDVRLGQVEVDLSLTMLELDDHVNATEAHGASGDIVGTDDFCTATKGGTVLLATPLSNKASFSATISLNANPAGAAYSQTDAATWVAMLNEIKADLNSLFVDHTILINYVNSIKTTQEAAKQRAV